MESLVSVIIPTTCEARRRRGLEQAIISVLRQTGVRVEIIIICNGQRQDPDLLTSLIRQSNLRVTSLLEGNVSKARYVGVGQASGDFFCFLDDDDEYLPGALSTRLGVMKRNPNCDVVVTNGFVFHQGFDSVLVNAVSAQEINSDIGSSFFKQNWFASPGGMFRKASIGADLFDFDYRFFEWTYLFFLLISKEKMILFDESCTYRVNGDTPESASKTVQYSLAYPEFIEALKKLELPRRLKTALHKKYLAALNAQSNIYLGQGQFIKSWLLHLKCVALGGWRYLPYTRHLIFPFSK